MTVKVLSTSRAWVGIVLVGVLSVGALVIGNAAADLPAGQATNKPTTNLLEPPSSAEKATFRSIATVGLRHDTVVPGVAAASVDEGVLISGRVIDADGAPFTAGTVFVEDPLRHRWDWRADTRLPIDARGEFRGHVSDALRMGQWATIAIHDGKAYVYRGVVPVQADLEIRTTSSRLSTNRLSGTVSIPNAKASDSWILVLATGGNGERGKLLADSGVFGACSGQVGQVELAIEPWDASYSGPVVATAMHSPQSPMAGRTLGQARLPSLAALRDALAVGVPIEGWEIEVTVDKVNGTEARSVAFASTDSAAQYFPHARTERGGFLLRVSPGSYYVRGTYPKPVYGIAGVKIDSERALHLDWDFIGPGASKLRVRVAMPDGTPAAHAFVDCKLTDVAGSPTSASIQAGDDGVAEAEGIFDGRYVVRAVSRDYAYSGFADAVVTGRDSYADVKLSPLSAVFVTVANASSLGLQAISGGDCTMWVRTRAEKGWHVVSSRERGDHGWIVSGLRDHEDYELAIRGAYWAGAKSFRTDQPLSAANVNVEPVRPVTGRLINAGGRILRVTAGRVRRANLFPWEECSTTGAFKIWAHPDDVCLSVFEGEQILGQFEGALGSEEHQITLTTKQ